MPLSVRQNDLGLGPDRNTSSPGRHSAPYGRASDRRSTPISYSNARSAVASGSARVPAQQVAIHSKRHCVVAEPGFHRVGHIVLAISCVDYPQWTDRIRPQR